jgi:hypothetical protein
MTAFKTLALPLALLAAPAMAANFTPPKGCTTYMTVQERSCMVSQFYTCEGDAKGDQWRADFGADGPTFLSKIDREAQWLESYQIDPQTKEVMDPNPKDPASFSELLANGLDTFDFTLTRSDGRHSSVKGFDRLTGKTVTIDGIALKQTEYEYTMTDLSDGSVIDHSKGNEFISDDWRTFLSGHVEFEQADGSWIPWENAPVKFFRAGSTGFQSTLPLFDCDAEAASYSPTP